MNGLGLPLGEDPPAFGVIEICHAGLPPFPALRGARRPWGSLWPLRGVRHEGAGERQVQMVLLSGPLKQARRRAGPLAPSQVIPAPPGPRRQVELGQAQAPHTLPGKVALQRRLSDEVEVPSLLGLLHAAGHQRVTVSPQLLTVHGAEEPAASFAAPRDLPVLPGWLLHVTCG